MSDIYFPGPGPSWQRAAPEAAGMDGAALDEAVRFARAQECDWPVSLYLADGRYIGTAYVEDKPPYDEVLGEVRPRARMNGLLLRGGRIIAEWGETERADTTFSAAKSYLALLAGVALDRGLIRSVDEPVRDYALDDGFSDPHNAAITWRHLLQQTSEWQGTLWDRPDSVDHNRQAGLTHDNAGKGTLRRLEAPGTRWEYNDVRVNRLALSLLQVFRRPLPEVLGEAIMDPIGASRDWSWRGYRNSVVEIDGRPMESVSGGGHWGGGLFIASRDHARVGYLVQNEGAWAGRQVLSRGFVTEMIRPSAPNPLYGFLWWLNTGRKLVPAAPETAVFALGGGQNVIFVDREHDLTVVVRWLARDSLDGFVGRVLAALR